MPLLPKIYLALDITPTLQLHKLRQRGSAGLPGGLKTHSRLIVLTGHLLRARPPGFPSLPLTSFPSHCQHFTQAQGAPCVHARRKGITPAALPQS